MGCDIHVEIEYQDRETGEYKNALQGIPNEAYRSQYKPRGLRRRHYALFAFLADVRNNDTLHEDGVRRFEPITPQFAERGVPDNATQETRESVESWSPGGHSHTYATFQELQNIDPKEFTVTYNALVDKDEYQALSNGEKDRPENPILWRSGVNKVSNEEMNDIIVKDKNPSPKTMTPFSYEKTLAEGLETYQIKQWFSPKVFLTDNHDVNGRIIFWFDN